MLTCAQYQAIEDAAAASNLGQATPAQEALAVLDARVAELETRLARAEGEQKESATDYLRLQDKAGDLASLCAHIAAWAGESRQQKAFIAARYAPRFVSLAQEIEAKYA